MNGNKRWRKVLALAVSLCMVVTMLPATAFAAGTPIVKINGQILQDGVEMTCGEGTAVLDETSGILTLNSATMNQTGAGPVLRVDNGDLKIVLIGENTITSTDARPFYCGDADISIQGTKADSLIIKTDSDGLQIDQGSLTLDGCKIDITSTEWSGIACYDGRVIIQEANLKINSNDLSIVGQGIEIADSMVNATSNGYNEVFDEGTNVIYSVNGELEIENSTVIATSISEMAYPAIYATGDINITNASDVNVTSSGQQGIYAKGNIDVTNQSNVEATSSGRQGIETKSDMTVTDSTVTATSTEEGGIYIDGGTLSLTNSKLSAASHPDIYAIVTKFFNVTNSEVTAKGGLLLERGEGEDFSFSITPANGKLVELKLDRDNWDGSAAVHFKGESESPYDATVTFNKEDMEKINENNYIHIGEHIHFGGTATCINQAECTDCGKPYGALGQHNFQYGSCTVCGAADPDYVPPVVYPVITSIAPVADQEYTGKAIEPALTVYDQDGEVITPNNYIVTYTDNVEPGVATVTVKGKAGVLGSATATFSIVKKEDPQPPQPEKPGKVEITDTFSDFGRIRIFFDRVDAIGDSTMRYQIQSQKVGSDVVKTQYATVGYSYATVRDLAYNAKYNIKIRAYYIDENGERIYGDWSDTKTVYANRLGNANQVMYAAGITKLTAGKTSVAVNLKKVAFTKNPVKITYQIAYRKKGAAKFSYAYTTGTSKTIAGLAKNTNYQFKVRYYYKSLVDNKLVFSPYTALKTVKTAR